MSPQNPVPSPIAITKEHILSEIKRTAKTNGGVPLGWRKFESESGIRYEDWYGKFWARWGDAVREAGFQPNRLSEAYTDQFLLENLALLTRKLGRAPVWGELLLAARDDPKFPGEGAFRRLGRKSARASRVIAFCEANPGFEDVAALWRQILTKQDSSSAEDSALPKRAGYVYLLQHGSRSEYKIGRTHRPVDREGEIGVQLPEESKPTHYIQTDDPAGIENYWQRRFSSKRKNGEWFALTADDIRSFRRWKRIF